MILMAIILVNKRYVMLLGMITQLLSSFMSESMYMIMFWMILPPELYSNTLNLHLKLMTLLFLSTKGQSTPPMSSPAKLYSIMRSKISNMFSCISFLFLHSRIVEMFCSSNSYLSYNRLWQTFWF